MTWKRLKKHAKRNQSKRQVLDASLVSLVSSHPNHLAFGVRSPGTWRQGSAECIKDQVPVTTCYILLLPALCTSSVSRCRTLKCLDAGDSRKINGNARSPWRCWPQIKRERPRWLSEALLKVLSETHAERSVNVSEPCPTKLREHNLFGML